MTPKEKAEELFDKMFLIIENNGMYDDLYKAKECALIAVEEIIKEVYNISHQYTAIYDEKTKFYSYTQSKELKFWQEVKQEICNL